MKAFGLLRKALDARPLLAMLTDEGFLPNYAFPEAGVTLKSVLWRRNPARGDGQNRSEELPPLSYERPANVAIRELVPDGQFYAQGRRVKVDQVDPGLNQPEHWRFCRSCSYACRSTDDDFGRKECPRCGNSGYADQGQVKEMTMLKQVQATTEDARSRFGDDADERNPLFFLRELLILPDLNRREISLAIEDEEFPFGVEYLASSTFREINFGEQAPVGQIHTIAGKDLKVRWGKVGSDDEYNAIRAKYGDSTSAEAQLSALRSLGCIVQFIAICGERVDVSGSRHYVANAALGPVEGQRHRASYQVCAHLKAHPSLVLAYRPSLCG